MLPSSRDGRRSYVQIRDFRSRWREWALKAHGPDRVKSESFVMLDSACDLEDLREQLDFMRSEGLLTAPMEEAAGNVIAWAEALQTILAEVPR